MPMPPKPEEEKGIKVSCILYQDELKFLTARAKERRISRSQLLRELLSDWIEKEKRHERPLQDFAAE